MQRTTCFYVSRRRQRPYHIPNAAQRLTLWVVDDVWHLHLMPRHDEKPHAVLPEPADLAQVMVCPDADRIPVLFQQLLNLA